MRVSLVEKVVRVWLSAIFFMSSVFPAGASANSTLLSGQFSENSEVEISPLHTPSGELVYYTPTIGDGPPPRTSPEPDEMPSRMPPRPDESPIELELRAESNIFDPDGVITLTATLTNHSDQAVSDLVYQDELPNYVALNSTDGELVTFDHSSRIVTSDVKALDAQESISFTYTIQIDSRVLNANANTRIWVHQAEVLLDGFDERVVASTHLWREDAGISNNSQVAVIPGGNGWVHLGQTSIYFEEGATAQDALVIETPIEVGQNGPPKQFTLDLVETGPVNRGNGGELLSQGLGLGQAYESRFNAPVFLEINFEEIGDLTNIPAGKAPYVATYDPEHDIWVKVPILGIDHGNNTVTAEVAHFSTWGAGLGEALPQNGANVLLFEQPYTSLFTGSSRYGINISAPPGRAGMQPSVNLSYSSATVDGVLGDVQAPWVGVGWNIDGIEIVRKILTDEDGYGYENSFSLTLNGTLYELIRDENNLNRYHTKRGSFLYIERHNPALGNEGDVDNASKEWWEVVATDGTRYRLGYQEDSEQLTLMYGYSCSTGSPCITPDGAYAQSGYAGVAEDLVPMRWRVDLITDTNGNFITYEYAETRPDPTSLVPAFDRESYLYRIEYTGHFDETGAVDLSPGYRIEFETASRDAVGDGTPNAYYIWDHYDTQLLDKVEIYCIACGIATPVRTYDFGYTSQGVPNNHGTLALTSMVISGGDFTEHGDYFAPIDSSTVRFEYQNLDNREVEGGSGDDVWTYPRLSAIHNGYGGELTFTYENDGRDSDSWYNWRVSDVEVDSGVGTVSTASMIGYEYSDPKYTGDYCGGVWDATCGELFGYETTKENTYDFDGDPLLAQTEHIFGIVGLDIGRELITKANSVSDGVVGDVEQQTVNIYVTDNSQAPFFGWNYRYLGQIETYQREDSNLLFMSKTSYQRDPGSGNLVLRSDYLGNSLYRKQYYEYYINDDPGVHILDKVSRQTLVDANNVVFSDVYYHYDGTINQTPTLGNLTLVQTCTGVDYVQNTRSCDTVDQKYFYDDYGNLIESYAFNDYDGELDIDRSIGSVTPTVATAYDTTFQTYPVSVTNATGIQSTSSAYYYSLGIAYEVTDLNGNLTTTEYDGLGRALSVSVPDVTDAVQYTYPVPDANGEVSPPYNIKMEILDTHPDPDVYRSVWAIYDGLGRILQNQTCSAYSGSSCTTVQVSDVEFNPMGLPEKQGIPRAVSGDGGSFYPPTWPANTYTTTAYDSLGRAVQVTAPGGITSSASYNGRTTISTDANGQRGSQQVDGLGRLIYVYDFIDEGQTLYATTAYEYDITNQLVRVTDADGNVTDIDYDWLGRKIQMDDPDMGIWAYEYDALGNLKKQFDPRPQVLEFAYDVLNRLITKTDITAEPDVVLTSYTYGSASPNLGYRTSMTDQSGSTSWTYSDYGRTVTTSETIGSETRSFETSTDWLGRVESITYPDNEVITYTYDVMGRAASFSSNALSGEPTLADLAYNTLGQVSTATLGNGAVITNTYDDPATGTGTYRLTERNVVANSVELLDFEYFYDPLGNITQINDNILGEIATYTYDDLNRLTSAESVSGIDYNYREQYQYDKTGNITEVTEWVDDRIFIDDFEAENLSSWDSSVTDSGDLVRSDTSVLYGSYSLEGVVDDVTPIYVQDDSPNNEAKYRARFYIDPTQITVQNDFDGFTLFAGYDDADPKNLLFKVELRVVDSEYQVRGGAYDDSASQYYYTNWGTISDDNWSAIEISWSNEGEFILYLNGHEVNPFTNLSNSGQTVSSIQLGVVANVSANISGSIFFDLFESRKLNYIGFRDGVSIPTPEPLPSAYPTEVVLDQYFTAGGATGTPRTINNISIGEGPDRLLVVVLAEKSATYGDASSITFDGIHLTRLDRVADAGSAVEIWYLVNPPATTGNVVITWPSDPRTNAAAIYSFQGVDQLDPFYDWDKYASSPASSWSVTLDTDSGSYLVAGLASPSGAAGWSNNITAIFGAGNPDFYISLGYAVTDGSQRTVTWTKSSSGAGNLLAASIRSSYHNVAFLKDDPSHQGLTLVSNQGGESILSAASTTYSNNNGIVLASYTNESPQHLASVVPHMTSSLATNLVAYWSLDQVSGTRIDSKGANDLTDNNTVGNNSGVQGNAATFSAIDSEYLSISDNVDLSTGDIDFTVWGWVKLASDQNDMVIASKADTGTNGEWLLKYDSTADRFVFEVIDGSGSSGSVTANNFGAPVVNTWYLLTAWHDSVNDTINIQVNDAAVDSLAWTTGVNDSTADLVLGTSAILSDFFDGSLDEVGFSKGILSEVDREWLYNRGFGRVYSSFEDYQEEIGEWHIDEGVGSIIEDGSTNANDGSLTNGASWDQGRTDWSIHFDGVDDYVSIPHAGELNPPGSFTVAAWVKVDSIGTEQYILAKNTPVDYGLLLDADGYLTFHIQDLSPIEGDPPARLAGPIPSMDEWFYVTGVYDIDASQMRMYVNGVMVAAQNVENTITIAAETMTFGGLNDGNGEFSGNVDEVDMFNYALTATEIQELYDAVAVNPIPSSLMKDLHSYWDLNETSGVRADVFGANDLTDNNTVDYDASGIQGNSADFTSANSEYLNISDNASLSVGDIDFTIWTWAKLDSDQNDSIIVSKADTGTNGEWLLEYDSTADRFVFRVIDGSGSSGSVTANTFGAPVVDTWYLVTAWHDSVNDTINIQVNDAAVDSLTWTTGVNDSTANFVIGSDATAQVFFEGKVDETAFSKKVLSADERSWLYNSGSGRDFDDLFSYEEQVVEEPPLITPAAAFYDDLIGYWELEEESGIRYDARNINDLTDNNTVGYGSAGIQGNSANFTAANSEYLNSGDTASLSTGDIDFTMWGWVKLASDQTDVIIASKADTGTNGEWLLKYDSTAARFVFEVIDGSGSSGSITANNFGAPVVDTWYLVTAWHDSVNDTINIQVDDNAVDTLAWTTGVNDSTADFVLGSDATAQVFFEGEIDEVGFSKNVLSGDDRAWSYNYGSGRSYDEIEALYVPASLTEDQINWGTGADGDLTVASGTTFNLHTDSSGNRSCADAVAYNVQSLTANSATLTTSVGFRCLVPGDEVLLINMQGTSGDTTNTGAYEYFRVYSVEGDTVTFTSQKLKWYGDGFHSDAGIGTGEDDQKVMLMRVPNYEDVSLVGTITGNAWNGDKYGFIAFRVSGEFSGSGEIDMDTKGFNGGNGGQGTRVVYCDGCFYEGDILGNGGKSGEGMGAAGTGGGGGGNGAWCSPTFPYQALRGAGGSFGTVGQDLEPNDGFNPGNTYGEISLSKMFLGSGGGGGGNNCGDNNGGRGGDGGGAILLHLNTVTTAFTGTISANGQNGSDGSGGKRGGSGSGGSVRIEGDNLDLSQASVSAIKGIAAPSGGEGRVAVYYQTSISNPSSSPDAYIAELGSDPPSGEYGNDNPWGTGADGNLDVTPEMTFNINTDTQNSSRSCTDGGDAVAYSVTELNGGSATLSAGPSDGCLETGDEVLLINLQGISTNHDNTGNYEFLRVGSVSGDTVYFTTAKQKYYGDGPGSDENIGTDTDEQRVMLIRVPNYNNVAVNGTLTANAWNGDRNGMVLFRASGSVSGYGTIKISGGGYKGGGGGTTGAGAGGSGWVSDSRHYIYGGGEGGGGSEIYWGKPGGGGGYEQEGSESTAGMAGGLPYGVSSLEKLFFGAGGGGGGLYQTTHGGSGGNGGGIVMVFGNSVNFTGTIDVRGGNGEDAANAAGTGGGGAGGSILIKGSEITLGTLNASGGTVSSSTSGSGGPGAHGRIAVYYESDYSGPEVAYLEHTGNESDDLIFSDGFNSGDMSAWSSTGTDGGDLSVSESAAYLGEYGLEAVVNDTSDLYVIDTTMVTKADYRARFYFNPGSLTMGSGEISSIFVCQQYSVAICLVELRLEGSTYQVRVNILDDSEVWTFSPWVDLDDGWNAIEIHWHGANVITQPDGKITLWVNGEEAAAVENIDNDTHRLDAAILGMLWLDANTNGTVFFDEFESHYYSYIGLADDLIFADGFESGAASAWDWVITDNGDLTVSTSAAYRGNYGLEAVVNDTHDIYVRDFSMDHASEYRARFYFNPGSLFSSSGDRSTIFACTDDTLSINICLVELRLDSTYQIRLLVRDDPNTWKSGPWTDLSSGWNAIEIYWKGAISSASPTGQMNLWLNGVEIANVENLDNDTHRFDSAVMGMTWLDANTNGTVYFDEFESRRYSYIGPVDDLIFADDFKSGDTSAWTLSETDGGDLFASTNASYFGNYGLEAVVDDTATIYLRKDWGIDEADYRARFYLDPSNLTMGLGDGLQLLICRDGVALVCSVQLSNNGSSYQIRVGLVDDSDVWTYSDWLDITDGWNAVEIQWHAAGSAGSPTGFITLWINGIETVTLADIDNDTIRVNSVFLGIFWPDANTSGTVYIDEFESRRSSYIGLLPDPGTSEEPITPAGWMGAEYFYDEDHPHAVISVEREQYLDDPAPIADRYAYDIAGNMTCRHEYDQASQAYKLWKHEYNAENRLSVVKLMDGTGCGDMGGQVESWIFTYNGDGQRVQQVHIAGTDVTTTYYFAGGAYEVERVNSDPATIKRYYSIAGMRVAMYDGTDLEYFATDHLGSTVLVMDDTGAKLSEQRYLPFGEVRTDVGTAITQTDFGYTGQRNYAGFGLMDYNARFYSPRLGKFTQPDTLIPGATNSQSWNRYSYVNNNPVIYNDPSGHIPEGACGYGNWDCKTDSGGSDDNDDGNDDNGGNDQPGDIDEDVNGDNNPYDSLDLPDWVPDRTQTYLQVGNQAWWILNHPNASVWQRALALGWLTSNATAWGLFATGLSLFGLTATGAITATGTVVSADGDPTNELATVYRVFQDGVVKYVGITNDYLRRGAEHLRERGWTIEPVIEDIPRNLARGVEQVLIEANGLAKFGGTLLNKINSIATSNPIYQEATQAGRELLQNLGMLP